MKKIKYSDLNSKQKESYNFQKVSSVLADYGYTTIPLSDDWQGADFIAMHVSGNEFLKVQLKGRLTLDKKYLEKNIQICFQSEKSWYLIPHDKVCDDLRKITTYSVSKSWIEKEIYHWGKLPKQIKTLIEKYKL